MRNNNTKSVRGYDLNAESSQFRIADCAISNLTQLDAECETSKVRGPTVKVQAECGMTNAECGIPDFGFEPPQRAEISARHVRTCVPSNVLGFKVRAGLRPLTYIALSAMQEGLIAPNSIAVRTQDHDCLEGSWARQ